MTKKKHDQLGTWSVATNIAKERFEVITQEDPETGDLLLPIPPQLLEAMGWKEGDNLDIDVISGTVILKKASK